MTRALTCLSLGAISVLLASSTAAGSSGRSSTIDEPIHKACAAVEVRGLVQRFVSSFIRGDLPRLGAVFQQERGFEWYSTDGTGERLRARATHRRSLVTYFVARHRRGEGLEVTRFGSTARTASHTETSSSRSFDGPRISTRRAMTQGRDTVLLQRAGRHLRLVDGSCLSSPDRGSAALAHVERLILQLSQ